MKCFDEILTIGNICCRLPSTIFEAVSKLVHQVIQLIADDLGIKDSCNLIFETISKVH
jgi:hypothetical protein